MSDLKQKVSHPMLAIIITLVVVFDQISKWLVVSQFQLGETIPVVSGFFNLTYVLNPGVAFGMFADLPDPYRYIVLGLTTALALGAVAYFLYFEYYHDRIAQACLAMIVGGAFGNIIDRIVYGRVVDFIDWYYGTYHWPAFNIADSAICVGVAILVFRKPAEKESDAVSAES